jgi:hypothetical protein
MGQTGKALSRSATQLPLTAISLGLQAWERSRPLRDFALRRGNEALQIAAHTPLGRLLPKQFFDDGADEEAAGIVADARQAVAPQTSAVTQPAAAPKPAPQTAQPAAATRKPTPAPAPKRDDAAARAVGAPGAVADKVEQITDKLDVDVPDSRDELPIPDFDNISIGSLRARLRTLSVEQLVTLREWEQAHANRLNVITTLDNRIAKLGTSEIAYPQEAEAAERAAEDEGGTLRV